MVRSIFVWVPLMVTMIMGTVDGFLSGNMGNNYNNHHGRVSSWSRSPIMTKEEILLQRIQQAMKRKLLRELQEKMLEPRRVDWRDLLTRPPSLSDRHDNHDDDEDEDEDDDLPDDFIGSLARVRRPQRPQHNESDLDPSVWRRERMAIMKKTSPTGAFSMENQQLFNFSTIGGYKEIKEELVQVTDFMRQPAKYEPYNVRLPRGILLHGEPGTGKTLFAKCVAGECNIPFIATSGSEFQDKYVGTGAARVRELFEFARQNTPCMIFIDEMDGIGRKRGADAEAAQAERDQTLNQLLVEMDGFKDNLQIMVIGSTNRIDILDPALLRPGRLDKHIYVTFPDYVTRQEIVSIHSYRKPINVTVDKIAKLTAGWTGAQIENLLNEATLYGIRKNELPINSTTLEQFVDYGTMGRIMTPLNLSMASMWRVAVHEMGHALVAFKSNYHEKPIKCTIVSSSGRMAGYTTFGKNDGNGGEDDGLLLTREYLMDRLRILLGGRIAEEIVFGASVSSGASNDLEKALDLARKMVMELGMGNRLVYPRWSERSRSEMDEDITQRINEAYESASAILLTHSKILRFMSQQLLLAKTLDKDQMEFLMTAFD